MSQGVEFDFSKLTDAVNKCVKAIEDLDQRLVSLGKASSVFNRLFRNTRDFDKFVDSINKLNLASSSNFKNIASGLSEISKALASLPEGAGAGFVKNIRVLITTLNELKTTQASQDRILRFVDGFVKAMQRLVAGLQTLPFATDVLKPITSLVTAINRIHTIFSSIGKNDVSTIAIGSIHNMIRGLILIATEVEANAAQIDAIAKLLNSIGKIVNELRGLSATFAGLGGKTPLTSLGKDGLVEFINRILPNLQQLGSLAASLTLLRSFIGQLASIAEGMGDVSRIAKLAKALSQFSTVIKTIFNEDFLPTSPEQAAARLFAANSALSQVKLLTTGISKIAVSLQGIGDIAKLGSALDNISSAMKKMDSFAQNIGADTRDLSANVSKEIYTRLQGFLNLTGTLDFVLKRVVQIGTSSVIERVKRTFGVSKLSLVLSEIANVAKQLSAIASTIPNLDSLSSLGSAMNNLANGIRILIATAANIPTGIKERLKRFLGLGPIPEILRVVGLISKNLAGVAKGIGNLDELGKLGRALSGISDFIKVLNQTRFPDLRGSKFEGLLNAASLGILGKPGKLQNFTNVIKEIAKAFKGFRGITIPDFSQIFPALINFATDTSVNFSKVNLSGFARFTKSLAEGLNNLSGVRVDATKLNAIGNALSGISKSSAIVGNVNVRNIQQATTQSASFLRGVLQGTISGLLTQAISSSFTKIQGFLAKLGTLDLSFAQHLRSIAGTLNQFGFQIQNIGNRLAQNFGLGALARSPLIDVASDFDHLSNQIRVFGDLTDQELKRVQAFADEIGINYPESANDALKSILGLIKAGQELNSIEFILPSAADLAILGDINIEDATRTLINATAAFDEYRDGVVATFDNVSIAADVISAAADRSTSSVAQISEALANVGPAAAQMGLSLEETAAAIALIGDAGLYGAEGGNQLRSTLNAFTQKPAQEEFARLNDFLAGMGSSIRVGIADAQGAILPFDQIVNNLASAFEELNLTQEQVINSLTKIGGSRARLGLQILIRGGGIQEFIDGMRGVETTAERAQVILQDFKGQADQLTGSIETLNKNAFLPMIQKSFLPFIRVIRTVVDGLIRLPPEIFDLASNVILLGSAFATFTASVLISVGIVARFESVLLNLGATIIWFGRNFIPALLGIGSFIASAGILVVSLTAIAGAVASIAIVFTSFRTAVEQNIGGAGDAFNRFRDAVERGVSRVAPVFREIGRVISLVFGPTIQREVDGFGQRVAAFFNRLTGGTTNIVDTMIQIGALFEGFGNFVEESFGGASADRVAFFEAQLEKLSQLPLIKSLFGARATPSGLRSIFKSVSDFFGKLVKSTQDILSGGIGILFGEPGSIKKVQKGLALLLSTITTSLQSLTGVDLSESILNFNEGRIGEGVGAFLRTVLEGIKNWFVANRSNIVRVITDVLITGAIRNTFNAVSFVLRVLGLEDAATAVTNIGAAIIKIIQDAADFVVRFLAGDVDFSGVQNFIDSFIGDPQAVTTELATRFKDLIVGALGQVPNLLRNIGAGLGIKPLVDLGVTLENSQAFEQISNALGNIASYPLELIGNVFSGVRSLVEQAGAGNIAAIAGLAGGIALLARSLGLLSKLPIVGAILLLNSALKNIDTLIVEHDLGTFLGDTLSGMTSDILSFVGVDLPAETIADRVTTVFEQLRDGIPILIGEIGRQIERSFNGLAATLVNAFNDARARLDVLGGGDNSFADAFFAAENRLFLQQPGEEIFGLLANPALDETTVKGLAVANAEKIIDAFSEALEDIRVSNIPDEMFNNLVKVLTDSDLLDDALSHVSSRQRTDFMARMLANVIDPEEAARVVEQNAEVRALVETMSRQILDAFTTGQAGFNNEEIRGFFLNLLEQNGVTGLTPGEQQYILTQITDSIKAIPFVSQGDLAVARLLDAIGESLDDSPALMLAVKTDVVVEAESIDISPLTIAIQEEFDRYMFRGFPAPIVPKGNKGGGNSLLSGSKIINSMLPKRNRRIPSPDTPIQPEDTPTEFDLGSTAASLEEARKRAREQRTKESSEFKKQLDTIKDGIFKTELDFEQKVRRLREKAREDEIKAEEALRHDRGNILEEGRESLLDAIRRGDGAAALAAVKNAKKQIKELEYNFEIQRVQREENLKDQISQAGEERKQRLAAYEDERLDIQNQITALANEQAQADAEELEEQRALHRSLEEQQAQHNSDIEDSVEQSQSNIDFAYEQTVIAAGGASAAIRSLADQLNYIRSVVQNIRPSNPKENDGGRNPEKGGGGGSPKNNNPGGGVVPLPPASPGGTPGSIPLTPTPAPKSPSRGTRYRDFNQIVWEWDGSRWIRLGNLSPTGNFSAGGFSEIGSASSSAFSKQLSGPSPRQLAGGAGTMPISSRPPMTPTFGPRMQQINLSVSIGDVYSSASDPAAVVSGIGDVLIPQIRGIVDKAGQNKKSRTMLEG